MTWIRRRAHERGGSAATVVGIMDRDSWSARTDNIVVAEPRHRRLVWIPRDLWSDLAGDRINEAFGRGGHRLLQAAVREVGIPACSSVVLLRSAVERALSDARITVPVDRPRRYWYPMAPTLRIQDGAKRVTFQPPAETLEGERIHQWIGARRSADASGPRLPDVDRIGRQQVLLRAMLDGRFDFTRAIRDPALIDVADDAALEALATVRADWALHTYIGVEPTTIDGKMVLRRRGGFLRRRLMRGGLR